MSRFAILALSAVLVAPAGAGAQAVSLSPSVVELAGRHGQSASQQLTLTNGTSLDLAFDLVAQDVVVAGGRRQFFAAGDLPNGIAATAVFSPSSMVVPAGTSRTATIVVTVPPGAGTRAVVALFKGTTRVEHKGSLATVSLGALMTFTLSGEASLASSDLTVVPQTGARNAAFELAMTNDGSEPVLPKGVAVILTDAGTIAGRVSFNSQRLLPGERATFRAEHPAELRAGSYRIMATFEYAGKAISRSGSLVVP